MKFDLTFVVSRLLILVILRNFVLCFCFINKRGIIYFYNGKQLESFFQIIYTTYCYAIKIIFLTMHKHMYTVNPIMLVVPLLL